jgi:hypothetical protein
MLPSESTMDWCARPGRTQPKMDRVVGLLRLLRENETAKVARTIATIARVNGYNKGREDQKTIDDGTNHHATIAIATIQQMTRRTMEMEA